MKKLFFVPLLACLAFLTMGATIIVKISEFPNTTTPGGSDLFILASGATNKNISWNQLKEAIGTNPATVTILNNLFVSNIYSTNITTTNLTVNNEFRGKTTFTTNLYVQQTVTNYYLFSTNLYLSYPTYTNNTYVSNYFQTNAFLNTYVSNYFNTNLFNYFTNLYTFSTNLTVTNFYLTDNYISNFFNTNIFVNNSYVSNFFATNIYNAYQITSNYYYQVYANLTNPTIAGLITSIGSSNYADPSMFMFSQTGDALKLLTAPTPSIQMVGSTPGSIILYSNTSQSISMNANGGAISAGGNVNARGFSHYTLNWSGPTNSIAAGDDDLYYASDTSIKITGFTGLPSDGLQTAEGLITYTNKQSTNVTITLPAGLVIPERTLSVTLSNASQGMLSWKYSQKAGTNGVYRQF